ncbi:MAG: GntR family transcriptional regulator [Gammaproteobacteria bacterium]|nr:GntR family transcriptional regulator [Gammaproteobacteria bacterium]
MFENITKQSISDTVFDQLTAKILDGDIDAGEALPSERQLCELLGVNRGAVREALKRLQQAGLVEVRHGGATTVLDYLDNGGLELLPQLMITPEGKMRLEVARSIVGMRQSMAPDIAKACASKRKEKHLQQLQSLLAQMQNTNNTDELQTLAFAYWRELVAGSGNIAFRLAFNSMQKAYDKIWSLLANVLEPELRDIANLEKLTQAIAEQNPEDAHHFATQYLLNGTNAMNAVLNAYGQSEIK